MEGSQDLCSIGLWVFMLSWGSRVHAPAPYLRFISTLCGALSIFYQVLHYVNESCYCIKLSSYRSYLLIIYLLLPVTPSPLILHISCLGFSHSWKSKNKPTTSLEFWSQWHIHFSIYTGINCWNYITLVGTATFPRTL